MSHPAFDESLPDLIRGLTSPVPANRVRSARALAKLGPTGQDAFQALFAATDDPEQAVREAAVQALGGFGVQVLSTLVQLLNHPCKYVRRNVVWAMGKLGPDARPVVRPLCNTLRDVDPRTAGGAAQALGGIGAGAADAISELAEVMRGTNVVLCRLAAKALSQIGPAALPTLVSHLKHHDPFVRGEAAMAVGWMGPAAAAAVGPLRDLLTARRPRTARGPFPNAYGGSGAVTPAAIAPPEASATEDTALVQVVQALGRIGPAAAEVEPLLLDLLTDHREPVRQAAADALKLIREV
jgi:HEAT repeat protein